MKLHFELWDSESANLLGAYESISGALADLTKAFPTVESKVQIADLVLTLELGGDDDDTMVLLDGAELYRLIQPTLTSEIKTHAMRSGVNTYLKGGPESYVANQFFSAATSDQGNMALRFGASSSRQKDTGTSVQSASREFQRVA
jgi:hypothetical protein